MDGAGINYLLAISDHLPSSELSQLILNLFISISKCTKRFPCIWNSSPFLPPPPSSALVNYLCGLGWVGLGCPLEGVVTVSWHGGLFVPAGFASALTCVLLQKPWNWNGCDSLACHTCGTILYSPQGLCRECANALRVGRETPRGCNDQTVIFIFFKFCFYLQANAGVEPFPRAFLWALPQGQGTFSLSVEQRVNAAFEFCLVFYALGPLSNGEYDEVIMEIHKLQPHEYQRKSWWSMLKECIKMQIICKWGAVNLVSINNLEHLIASGLDEF